MSVITRRSDDGEVILQPEVLRHFGLEANTMLEIWDISGLDWVAVRAGAVIPAHDRQRSVFGRIQGVWAPEGFHLESLLASRGNQAVFDDPWTTDMTTV